MESSSTVEMKSSAGERVEEEETTGGYEIVRVPLELLVANSSASRDAASNLRCFNDCRYLTHRLAFRFGKKYNGVYLLHRRYCR